MALRSVRSDVRRENVWPTQFPTKASTQQVSNSIASPHSLERKDQRSLIRALSLLIWFVLPLMLLLSVLFLALKRARLFLSPMQIGSQAESRFRLPLSFISVSSASNLWLESTCRCGQIASERILPMTATTTAERFAAKRKQLLAATKREEPVAST